jgi:hypothetical protein
LSGAGFIKPDHFWAGLTRRRGITKTESPRLAPDLQRVLAAANRGN